MAAIMDFLIEKITAYSVQAVKQLFFLLKSHFPKEKKAMTKSHSQRKRVQVYLKAFPL